jgi:DnaJ-class molecular chaperone
MAKEEAPPPEERPAPAMRKCGRCPGSGLVLAEGTDRPVLVTCPVCHGSGEVRDV